MYMKGKKIAEINKAIDRKIFEVLALRAGTAVILIHERVGDG